MLSDSDRTFLEEYEARLPEAEEVAGLAEEFLREVLSQGAFSIHLISARAKDVDSVRMKLSFKDYQDPSEELTDQVGVRIMTYYGSEVDDIVERLRSIMTVDEANSLDKRKDLAETQRFGYRSVHLVGKFRPYQLRDLKWTGLRGHIVEVQVRSLLDHVWAEIEHELSYKSGIDHDAEFLRRFAAVAGTLEILEREFLELRSELHSLVEMHKRAYSARRQTTVGLDAARLIAVLEVDYPEAKGWRHAERVGAPLVISPAVCVKALKDAEIASVRNLRRVGRRLAFRDLLETYAAEAGIAPAETPHLLVVLFAVASKDRSLAEDYFRPLLALPGVRRSLGAGDDDEPLGSQLQ